MIVYLQSKIFQHICSVDMKQLQFDLIMVKSKWQQYNHANCTPHQLQNRHTIYTWISYAFFVPIVASVSVHLCDPFIHILQSCFTGTGEDIAIIGPFLITVKHNKALAMCLFRDIDGLVQIIRNCSTLAMESCLSCTNPSIRAIHFERQWRCIIHSIA